MDNSEISAETTSTDEEETNHIEKKMRVRRILLSCSLVIPTCLTAVLTCYGIWLGAVPFYMKQQCEEELTLNLTGSTDVIENIMIDTDMDIQNMAIAICKNVSRHRHIFTLVSISVLAMFMIIGAVINWVSMGEMYRQIWKNADVKHPNKFFLLRACIIVATATFSGNLYADWKDENQFYTDIVYHLGVIFIVCIADVVVLLACWWAMVIIKLSRPILPQADYDVPMADLNANDSETREEGDYETTAV